MTVRTVRTATRAADGSVTHGQTYAVPLTYVVACEVSAAIREAGLTGVRISPAPAH